MKEEEEEEDDEEDDERGMKIKTTPKGLVTPEVSASSPSSQTAGNSIIK